MRLGEARKKSTGGARGFAGSRSNQGPSSSLWNKYGPRFRKGVIITTRGRRLFPPPPLVPNLNTLKIYLDLGFTCKFSSVHCKISSPIAWEFWGVRGPLLDWHLPRNRWRIGMYKPDWRFVNNTPPTRVNWLGGKNTDTPNEACYEPHKLMPTVFKSPLSCLIS